MIPYMAGFFDAEGNVWAGKGGVSTIVRCNVSQKDPRILLELQKEFGGIHTPKHFRLSFNGQKAVKLLTDIIPYLIVKKPEAELALSIFANRHTSNVLRDHELWQNRNRSPERLIPFMQQEAMKQYIAGFLDGDGHISKIDKHLAVCQKTPEPLYMMQQYYQGTVFQRKDGMWQWRIWTSYRDAFLKDILPLLRSPRFDYLKDQLIFPKKDISEPM